MFTKTQSALCALFPTMRAARRQARLALRSGNYVRAADRYALAARRLERILARDPYRERSCGDSFQAALSAQLGLIRRSAGAAFVIANEEDRNISGVGTLAPSEPQTGAVASFLAGAEKFLTPDEQLLFSLRDPLAAPSHLQSAAARPSFEDRVQCGIRTLFGVRTLEAQVAVGDTDALADLTLRAQRGDGSAYRALLRLARYGNSAADERLGYIRQVEHEQHKARERERARRIDDDYFRARMGMMRW
ncbi:MAG: hypothetical protein HY696_11580 [Deltaproteobacteria bacterium]|nr:hypothetical protein [Deltaproteobacteria bacterium]